MVKRCVAAWAANHVSALTQGTELFDLLDATTLEWLPQVSKYPRHWGVSSRMSGSLHSGRRIWLLPMELAVPALFIATVVLIAGIYLALDFHRARNAFVSRHQEQARNLAVWVDGHLRQFADMVESTPPSALSACTREARGHVERGLGMLPVTHIEVRNAEGMSCAWQPRFEAFRFAGCRTTSGDDIIPVPFVVGEGQRVVAFVDTVCLFRGVIPMGDDQGSRYHLVSVPADHDEAPWTLASQAGSAWLALPFSGDFTLMARSSAWLLAVVMDVPKTAMMGEWLAQLPLQLSLIGGLSLALWFGPMALVRRRLSIEGQVESALRRGDFFLAYLPTVELASMDWIGAEALLRWRHGRYGVLMPGAFIPWIEQSPLIFDTTRWVVMQAAHDLTHMSRHNPEFQLAVNVPPNLLADHRLLDAADEAFGKDPLALCQVVFELTERQMGEFGQQSVRHVMKSLRQRGAQFALDDFGVGFSNLSVLQQVEVDYVKIDRSFVQDWNPQRPGAEVLEAMILLIRSLGVLVVVEGVETERELERIKRYGIRFAQGFLFSRPVELDALLTQLAARAQEAAKLRPTSS